MGKSLQFIDALDSQSPRKLRTKEKKKVIESEQSLLKMTNL